MTCRGQYVMPFHGDDEIYREGLICVLDLCWDSSAHQTAAFIFHPRDQDGQIVGTPFSRERSNFVKLRADEGVTGDKKEIVRVELLTTATYDPKGTYRRVPTSLSGARIALRHDTACLNESIGVKHYLAVGMTSKAWKTQLNNSYPIYLLHRAHCAAFFRGRYRSVEYFFRSMVGVIVYGLIALTEIGQR